MRSFIFVRHGESEANLARLVSPPDTPLTQKGLQQAEQTGQALSSKDIDVIISSPMPRARQTAEVIAGEVKFPISKIKIIDQLKERGGVELEGKQLSQPQLWYFVNDDPREESRSELFKRMKEALDVIEKYVEQGHTVLVSGHGVSGYFLQQIAKGKKSYLDFDPPNFLLNADYLEVSINES